LGELIGVQGIHHDLPPLIQETSNMAVRNYPREHQNSTTQNMVETARSAQKDMVSYVREYARENPEAAALWCLGIGFLLGWKLKPW
jgi:hypothetical protein